MRPGRIDKKIYVPLPDDDSRKKIFLLELGKLQVENEVFKNIDTFVEQSKDYSGAEVYFVICFLPLLFMFYGVFIGF